ncbi:MJ1255/VC2487 family glycosyltransferase [Methylomarinum sp. Ch1-1]|uniref:MJ1255/VC2487 family glycosyltransferase n=1 Tax=Methylomarinum roseum TaxID=3067653 RepID=A0AAU7NVG1_9GAMM
MKIFYGVQGTGNGHITRARVMAKELYAAGFDVTFQFTGRPPDKFFDMEIFNGYQHREGLTFNSDNGKVSYIKTVLQSKPICFIRDVKALDLSGYDLVISDFEPVTAWAAKVQKKNTLGIGHQYAFKHDIPRTRYEPLAELVMKFFAPVGQGVGLHWHHFDQPILPPIIETPELPSRIQGNKVVVYLPFEDQHAVIKHLLPFKDYQFHLYSPVPVASDHEHIVCNPLSRDGFQRDLYDCVGIISNAGFELASESLQLGKKILAKPLHAQMEQIANAAALEHLGYGRTMTEITPAVIEEWLHDKQAVQVSYPNIARVIVDWIKDGKPAMESEFIARVWDRVKVSPVDL